MKDRIDGWVRDSLDLLATFQFTDEGVQVLREAPIRLLQWADIPSHDGPSILMPTDVPTTVTPDDSWFVPFGSDRLTVWNRVPRPEHDWEALPSEAAPLWWRHQSGTLVPAWNLWGNVRDLLTFREEREIGQRDAHGRFPSGASPRAVRGLLGVPVANDANAALLDAALALRDDSAPCLLAPPHLLRAVSVTLSHDCDQLRGNDVFTQGVRGLRATAALASGHLTKARRHFGALIRNALQPRRFYGADLEAMIAAERSYGFGSVCYFLTGRGGRFGARGGSRIAARYAGALPEGHDAGIHYNYNTVGDDGALQEEMERIRASSPRFAPAGRAHYLRFDPTSSPAFLARHGIRYDESIGWPDVLGYRCGVAGPFFPFDERSRERLDVLELPLACMDAAVRADAPEGGVARLLAHLQAVGGILSVLFHPGIYDNPEYPEYSGLYDDILARIAAGGGRSWTPREILDHADAWAARQTG